MKLHPRSSALAAFVLGLTLHAASARADVFDWNNFTYAPANAAAAATTTALGNSTNGSNSLSVKMVLSTGAAFYTGVQSPASGSYSGSNVYASGGGADTQKSLQVAVNFANNTQFVTVTLTFAKPVVSAAFSFFDVDSGTITANGVAGGYIDQIRGIQGTTASGATVNPVSLTAGADNTVSGNSAMSNSNNPIDATYTNAQNASGGNVAVAFDSSTPITQLTYVYGDVVPTGANHSVVQITALSNINFTNAVPEPGTTAMLTLGIFGAGVVAFRRRA